MKKLMVIMFVFGMVSVMGIQAKADLLVHYNLDEVAGVTANDASGNGHTGTFTVGSGGYSPPVIWDSGSKPSLDVLNVSSARITDNVNALIAPDDDDLDGLTSFTVMMWVNNSPTNDSGFPTMAAKYDRPGGGHAGFVAYWSGDKLSLLVGGVSSNPIVAVSANPAGSLSGWHHWAVTYDGTNTTTDNIHFYLDGQSIGSGVSYQGALLDTSTDLYVSSRGDADFAQRQLFDEFGMYGSAADSSGALNQEGIQEAMTGIPEPATMLLLGFGGFALRRRKN